jgi:hypothetical protein
MGFRINSGAFRVNSGVMNIKPAAPTYAVGDSVLGGIVGYIYQSGDPGYDANVQHGLIIAPADSGLLVAQNTNYTSSNWHYGVSPSPSTIGSGSDNTDKIIGYYASGSLASGSYAAYVARNNNSNGYTDWFLPSTNELLALWGNRSLLNISNTQYWTSTGIPPGVDNPTGYYTRIRWSDGNNTTNAPFFTNWVRAVRYF